MHLTGPGLRLRIYIGETDHWHHRPLYDALVVRAREMGLAGATVMRGLEGFGARSRLRTAKVLRLSENLPIVVELVDREERIREFVGACDEMITDGLVTIEPVEILKYTTSLPRPAP
jgi:PII-like signaling protein